MQPATINQLCRWTATLSTSSGQLVCRKPLRIPLRVPSRRLLQLAIQRLNTKLVGQQLQPNFQSAAHAPLSFPSKSQSTNHPSAAMRPISRSVHVTITTPFSATEYYHTYQLSSHPSSLPPLPPLAEPKCRPGHTPLFCCFLTSPNPAQRVQSTLRFLSECCNKCPSRGWTRELVGPYPRGEDPCGGLTTARGVEYREKGLARWDGGLWEWLGGRMDAEPRWGGKGRVG